MLSDYSMQINFTVNGVYFSSVKWEMHANVLNSMNCVNADC